MTKKVDDARREGLRAQRAMLTNLLNTGAISEHVFEEIVTEIDTALVGEAQLGEAAPDGRPTPENVGAAGRRDAGMMDSTHRAPSAVTLYDPCGSPRDGGGPST